MLWFINERSLHFQYNSDVEAADSVAAFIGMIRPLVRAEIVASNRLHLTSIRPNVVLIRLANHLQNRELKAELLRTLFDRGNPVAWEVDRVSDAAAMYQCLEADVSDSSMAEAAERGHAQAVSTVGLLNFRNSFLSGVVTAQVIRDGEPLADIPCFEDAVSVGAKLAAASAVGPYDVDTAQDPPIDVQTSLADRNHFRRRAEVVQGRTTYEHLLTRTIWYVDNLHFGQGAHLEVFDRRRYHLGEAPIDATRPEQVVAGTREPDRRLGH